jgi:hypothetical protein
MTQEERVSGGRHTGKSRINRQGSMTLHPMMKTELGNRFSDCADWRGLQRANQKGRVA